MEWLKRMTDAIEYMEKHMEEPFDASKVARVACSSTFHFQRMFDMITGNTVAEYVRKRKLTLAAQELTAAKVKVIDIALKYGYDTPESFSKAFRRLHGISPSAAREPGAILKAYPPISFQLSLKGDKNMDYRIIEKEAFQVIGKAKKISTKDGINFKQVPEFWDECKKDKIEERLEPYNKSDTVIGICADMEHEKERFTYMIAVESDEKPKDGEFVTRTIPASTWAVFTSIGPMPSAIQKVWDRIWQEWFPATGFEHAGTAELEIYPCGDLSAPDYKCEVWIPIIKK